MSSMHIVFMFNDGTIETHDIETGERVYEMRNAFRRLGETLTATQQEKLLGSVVVASEDFGAFAHQYTRNETFETFYLGEHQCDTLEARLGR